MNSAAFGESFEFLANCSVESVELILVKSLGLLRTRVTKSLLEFLFVVLVGDDSLRLRGDSDVSDEDDDCDELVVDELLASEVDVFANG